MWERGMIVGGEIVREPWLGGLDASIYRCACAFVGAASVTLVRERGHEVCISGVDGMLILLFTRLGVSVLRYLS
jgi:hypothetical protein